VKTIRKSRAKEADFFADNAVLSIDHGAHLKIKSTKLFGPKFAEDDALWNATISARVTVVDDRTEEGDFDGLEFQDWYDLKVDLDVLDQLGLTDTDLKDASKADFSREQREALLDPGNWTIRDGSKADKLSNVVLGKDWADKPFHPDLWVDKEFIAKVHPRTGKRPGSYCGWDTFLSINPPKKKKKAAVKKKNTDEVAEPTAHLTEAEERTMQETLG